jgi:hypothetical protein
VNDCQTKKPPGKHVAIRSAGSTDGTFAPLARSYDILHREDPSSTMDNLLARFLNRSNFGTRRRLLRSLGVAAGASFTSRAFGQGRCRDGYGTSSCPLTEESATAPIPALFARTGWKIWLTAVRHGDRRRVSWREGPIRASRVTLAHVFIFSTASRRNSGECFRHF